MRIGRPASARHTLRRKTSALEHADHHHRTGWFVGLGIRGRPPRIGSDGRVRRSAGAADGHRRGHCGPCSRPLSQSSHWDCWRLSLTPTPHRLRVCAFGGGVIGNTAGSGPVIEGSSPSPRARVGKSRPNLVPSSRGRGRRPLKPETPVQIWSGLQNPWSGAIFRLYTASVVSNERRLSLRTAHEPISGAYGLSISMPNATRSSTRCPFGMGRRPQLEVLDSIVGAIPVAMMDDFVREQGATQMQRHHQPMLTHLGRPTNHLAQLLGDSDDPVPVME